MNYADFKGGTWYPKGGMYSVVDAMYRLALESGVSFCFNEAVTSIDIKNRTISSVTTSLNQYKANAVISSADYHFTEEFLLSPEHRSYSPYYWEKRTLAPSCLLYYTGVSKKLTNIKHHTLFFDTSFELHGKEIYQNPCWPSDPLFYVSANSVSDDTVAPHGSENLVFLIPIAAGLTGDVKAMRDIYFKHIVKRFESRTGTTINDSIIYSKTISVSDFANDYNSFKGNAYGLANTLTQTSLLKPKCKSRKVNNLFYTGQFTVPGPGVPPCIISGEVVAKELLKEYSSNKILRAA